MDRVKIFDFVPPALDNMCVGYLGAHCDLLLSNVAVGFGVGLAARLIVPGRDPAGIILTTLIGFCGAMFGSFLGPMVGFTPATPLGHILLALGGAMCVVLALKVVALA